MGDTVMDTTVDMVLGTMGDTTVDMVLGTMVDTTVDTMATLTTESMARGLLRLKLKLPLLLRPRLKLTPGMDTTVDGLGHYGRYYGGHYGYPYGGYYGVYGKRSAEAEAAPA